MVFYDRERGGAVANQRHEYKHVTLPDGSRWLLWELTTAGADLINIEDGSETTITPRQYYKHYERD